MTLALEDQLIEQGREYARRHGVQCIIRDLLRRRVIQEADWISETFRAMDEAQGRSRGRKWSRSELYDA